MATEISLIASLLHLRCVDNGIEARQAVESGSCLVREDDVKAVVVKLRAAHDKSRDEMGAMRERAEKLAEKCAALEAERDAGVRRERARVVADLRAKSEEHRSWSRAVASILNTYANRYERGEHESEGT